MSEPSESAFTTDVHGGNTLGVNLLAGIAGGCAGVLAGHPLDTIKVRLQAASQSGPNPEYKGGIDCFRKIITEEGVIGLYKGMGSPLVGVAVVNSLLFGVYGYTLRALGDPESINTIFWAGAISGVVNGFFSCPMELVKIRLQNQHGSSRSVNTPAVASVTAHYPKPSSFGQTGATGGTIKNPSRVTVSNNVTSITGQTQQMSTLISTTSKFEEHIKIKKSTIINPTRTMMAPVTSAVIKRGMHSTGAASTAAAAASSAAAADAMPYYRGPVDCVKQIFQAKGIRGLFQGLNCTLLRETPSYAAYFATYEYLCEQLLDDDANTNEPSAVMLFAGGFAGVICWIVTYPLDVVKTRLQSVEQDKTGKYKGTIDCFKQIIRTEGYKVLTKGLAATCVRAFPTNAATFYAVSYARHMLAPLFGSNPVPDVTDE